MKIKSVKNVDNGTEVVVFLDKNETLDIDMCRKAGKQAEYDAYVIVDAWDGSIMIRNRSNDQYLHGTVTPNELTCMIFDGVVDASGNHWAGNSKYFHTTYKEALDSWWGVKGRRTRIKGFNTKTGQLFNLEED